MLDYRLGEHDGLEVLASIRELGNDVPTIVLNYNHKLWMSLQCEAHRRQPRSRPGRPAAGGAQRMPNVSLLRKRWRRLLNKGFPNFRLNSLTAWTERVVGKP